ncbi:hypothetical protein JMJ77_0007804, partial [Colletotrichum scovillei]
LIRRPGSRWSIVGCYQCQTTANNLSCRDSLACWTEEKMMSTV